MNAQPSTLMVSIDENKSILWLEERLRTILTSYSPNTVIQLSIRSDHGDLQCLMTGAALYFVATLIRAKYRVQIYYDDITDWTALPATFLYNVVNLGLLSFTQQSKDLAILSRKKDPAPIESLIRSIDSDIYSTSKGVVINRSGGTSLSVVHFDPIFDEAPALQGAVSNWIEFKNKLSVLLAKNHSSLSDLSKINPATRDAGGYGELFYFLYELNQNSYEHARISVDGRPIAGVRFFQLRLRNFASKNHLERWAAALPRVANALTDFGQTSRLLEISISDFGLGILETYCRAKQPAQSTSVNPESRALLSRILSDGLTSKTGGITGQGWGLRHALDAVNNLSAVLVARTGAFFVYRSYQHERNLALPSGLVFDDAIENEAVASIAGTHWTMWLPIP